MGSRLGGRILTHQNQDGLTICLCFAELFQNFVSCWLAASMINLAALKNNVHSQPTSTKSSGGKAKTNTVGCVSRTPKPSLIEIPFGGSLHSRVRGPHTKAKPGSCADLHKGPPLGAGVHDVELVRFLAREQVLTVLLADQETILLALTSSKINRLRNYSQAGTCSGCVSASGAYPCIQGKPTGRPPFWVGLPF